LCRYKPKQPEKISKKRFLLGGSRIGNFFFIGSNGNKPKVNLFWLFFVFFCETKKFVRIVSVFRTGIETTETNRAYGMVWGIEKVDIFTNLLLFWLVFCLFRLFRNTETPCFDIKAEQPKQTSFFRIVLKPVSVLVSVVLIRN
jgi:hypothetical protein